MVFDWVLRRASSRIWKIAAEGGASATLLDALPVGYSARLAFIHSTLEHTKQGDAWKELCNFRRSQESASVVMLVS